MVTFVNFTSIVFKEITVSQTTKKNMYCVFYEKRSDIYAACMKTWAPALQENSLRSNFHFVCNTICCFFVLTIRYTLLPILVMHLKGTFLQTSNWTKKIVLLKSYDEMFLFIFVVSCLRSQYMLLCVSVSSFILQITKQLRYIIIM